VQDDDFLILPEIIRALSLRANNRNISAIHLQPPDEMLTSQLRSIEISDKIQTTFAWLGYGTIIQRSRAIEFLSLLKELDLTDEEHKMADNYFTILRNEIPERWFDQGIELGGGQPFTVGTAGEARNLRHIVRSLRYLVIEYADSNTPACLDSSSPVAGPNRVKRWTSSPLHGTRKGDDAPEFIANFPSTMSL